MKRRLVLLCGCFSALVFGGGNVSGDDWPQWMGPQRDGVWRESGVMDRFPDGGPKILWRTPIGGGYAGPAVANHRVYITDKVLPAETKDPENPFQRGKTPAQERVHCLDARDGSILWTYEYDCPYTVSYPAGPRTTPTVAGDKVYTLGAEGHLCCLDAERGTKIWSLELQKEYGLDRSPVWGFASNPLLDGSRLICLVGGPDSAVVAFDANTGKEIWRALSATGDHGPGYSSPVIIDAAGRRQLIVWHPQAVSSLDPETGEVLWEEPFPVRQGLSVPTPRHLGDRLFVTAFYDGSLMLKLDSEKPGAEVLWKRGGENEINTEALHSIIATPLLTEDTIYGVDSYGEFRALDAASGERLWETFAPTSGRKARWGTAFIIPHEDRTLLFSENGDLILAQLSREGYSELGRAHLIEPTGPAQRRDVVWSHPAFADRCVFVRNDKEIVCASLAVSE